MSDENTKDLPKPLSFQQFWSRACEIPESAQAMRDVYAEYCEDFNADEGDREDARP